MGSTGQGDPSVCRRGDGAGESRAPVPFRGGIRGRFREGPLAVVARGDGAARRDDRRGNQTLRHVPRGGQSAIVVRRSSCRRGRRCPPLAARSRVWRTACTALSRRLAAITTAAGWLGKIHWPSPPGWARSVANAVGGAAGYLGVTGGSANGSMQTPAGLRLVGERGPERCARPGISRRGARAKITRCTGATCRGCSRQRGGRRRA